MKKLLLLSAFAASALAFSPALRGLELSAGLGGSASPYMETARVASGADYSTREFQTMHYGVFGYVDATYVEASAGIGWSSGITSLHIVDGLDVFGESVDVVYSGSDAMTYLSLGLLFKYPFDMTDFYVFPILGVEYDLNLGYKDGEGNDLKADMSAEERANLDMLWLKAGCGLDIPIAGRLYLRPEALVAYKVISKLDQDWVDDHSAGMDTTYWRTVKADIRFLAGWKF